MNVHQFLPTLSYGDAIGNDVLLIQKQLQAWGFNSEIFIEHVHPALKDRVRHFNEFKGSSEDIIIFHFSIGSAINKFVRSLPNRIVLRYHNVTPAHFFHTINPAFARLLGDAHDELATFSDVPLSLADSDFNRQELLELGFKSVLVVPCMVGVDALAQASQTPEGQTLVERYRDGVTNILFVGRIAPNKRQADVVQAFAYYHKLINQNSRLLLVGSTNDAPIYFDQLSAQISRHGLPSRVVFGGHISNAALGAYYQVADLFLSMSEHEGFGVPLVESMHFGVPILAFKSTAVPGTLGGAGVLFTQKDIAAVAEMMNLLITDQGLHGRIVAKQHERARFFSQENVGHILEGALRPFLAMSV